MNQLDSSISQEQHNLPVVLVAGLSGAGKSTAVNVFEDMHFLTVDGLPIELVPQIADMVRRMSPERYHGLALGVDLREESLVKGLEVAIQTLAAAGINAAVLFLEAGEDILLRRYAATRRPHPLEAENLGLEQAIREEKRRLAPVRALADLVVDTSAFSIHDLRRLIQKKWSTLAGSISALRINLISFGFKYGAPADADMLFDLRFLPNPYFEPELRELSGLDKAVSDYVLAQQGTEFLERLLDFLNFLLPRFEAEGRYRLTLGIGCTGGRHRSVAIAEALGAALRQADYSVSMEHRHLELG